MEFNFCDQCVLRKIRMQNQPTKRSPKVSNRRMNNFLEAYSTIKWDFNSLELTVIGYGDRPAFTIEGILYTNEVMFRRPASDIDEIKVRFHSNTPGGGASRIYFWFDEKRYTITYATYRNPMKTLNRLMNKYHELKEIKNGKEI